MNGLVDFFRLIVHRNLFSHKHIQAYQLKQLNKLINHAKKHAPYYQKTLHPLTSLNELNQLPLINKAILMEHFDTINTVGIHKDEAMKIAVEKEKNKDYLGYYQDHFVLGLSSGTSGNKGLFITPKSLTKKLPFVFLARSGLPLRFLPYRILFMLRVFSQGFNDINAPMISLKYLSTMTPVDEIMDQINTHKINILMAPPSLCRLLLPQVHHIHRPLNMIVTYAEVLEEEEKQRLASAFQCKVIEIYQASEGQMASACSHGRLHINEDMVLVELKDQDMNEITQPHVVAHKMIITNLVNVAQPLIRYEMNDLIVLDDPCPCGSHFRTIKHVLGRHDDVFFFTLEDGTKQPLFPDLISRWIITTSENIREYQLIQHNDESCELIIDPIIHNDLSHLKAQLIERLTQACLEYQIHLKIKVTFKAIPLPQDKAKYKRFIVQETQDPK